MKKLLFLSFFSLTLGGCAIGSKMDLSKANFNAPEVRVKSVSVVGVDERPYVLDGDKTPEWIGLQRGGYGNPFGVHTESGDPLADDLANSIASALSRQASDVGVINVEDGTLTTNQAISKIKTNHPKDRNLVLVVKNWKSDTMVDVNFEYDLELIVLDRRLRKIASKRITGNEALDGSFWNPVGVSERVVRERKAEIFGQLLSSSEISRALN